MNLMAAIATSTPLEQRVPSSEKVPSLHIWLMPATKGLVQPGHGIVHTIAIVPGGSESDRLSPEWFGAGC